MRRSAQVLLLAVALLLPMTSAATAGPPPLGLYECTISGVGLFGDVKIKKDNKYERFGKKGKFTSNGRKIKFTTGPFKGFKGKWEKSDTTPVIYEIELENPVSDEGFTSIYCTK
jgi:hypothetical protein